MATASHCKQVSFLCTCSLLLFLEVLQFSKFTAQVLGDVESASSLCLRIFVFVCAIVLGASCSVLSIELLVQFCSSLFVFFNIDLFLDLFFWLTSHLLRSNPCRRTVNLELICYETRYSWSAVAPSSVSGRDHRASECCCSVRRVVNNNDTIILMRLSFFIVLGSSKDYVRAAVSAVRHRERLAASDKLALISTLGVTCCTDRPTDAI